MRPTGFDVLEFPRGLSLAGRRTFVELALSAHGFDRFLSQNCSWSFAKDADDAGRAAYISVGGYHDQSTLCIADAANELGLEAALDERTRLNKWRETYTYADALERVCPLNDAARAELAGLAAELHRVAA